MKIRFEKKNVPPKPAKPRGENQFNQITEAAIAKRKDSKAIVRSNDQSSDKKKEI